MNKSLKILVTGASGDLGRSMIYYLNKFNFDIIAADVREEFLCAPKTIRRYLVPKATEPAYIDKINRIISKNKIEIVIFQSDLEIRIASKNIDKIKAKVWLPNYKVIKKMQDKYWCNQVWRKVGVSAPFSEILFKKEQLRDNVWLRPLGYIGGGGKYAIHAKTKGEALLWIEKYNGWGKFTSNEYLPGRMYGFDSLWKEGRLIGSSLKERLKYNNEGVEIGYTSNIVKTTRNDAAIKTAILAIKTITSSPDGIFSVDMRENGKGIPSVTEINPGRFMTTSLLLFRETNYDLPLDYINLILGKKIALRKPLSFGRYLFFVKGLTRLATEKEMRIEKI